MGLGAVAGVSQQTEKVCLGGIGDPHFGAVDNVIVTVFACFGFDIVDIGSRARFAHCNGADHFAFNGRHQKFVTEFLAAKLCQRRCAHVSLYADGQRHSAAVGIAKFFSHYQVVRIIQTHAAVFFWLLANTGDGPKHKNKSLIVVPAKSEGISFSEKLNKLGMRSSDTAQVFFDNVRVPQKNLIGMEGQGFMLQMMQFQEERLWGAANAIGGLENCIRATIEYTKDREAFGQRLIDNQTIHFRLAELQTEVEMLRALVYSTCERYINNDNPNEILKLASMCKLKGGRLAREVSDSCLQYWGGMGFMWDNLVSRSYRDSRLASIGGGADEVMLGIICKTMDILPGKPKD